MLCRLVNFQRWGGASSFISKALYSSADLPQLSSIKYAVLRNNAYSNIQDSDINHFRSILGDDRVLTDPQDVLPYNIDWIKNCRGQASVVLKPKTTEEVSRVLAHCHVRRLAVCPQGGNTGLVGGSVPVFDEIVISLGLMDRIISFDATSGAVVCEAGCILEKVDQWVRERGHMMPLDLGAKGTAHVGGNLSTNAGGLRLLRYGNLHGTTLGLEAVRADGSVVDCLRTLRKDNTGYHLKHLFIGSEGTLGIITKLALHCPPAPRATTIAFFGVSKFEDVTRLYEGAKSKLGEILSAFEVADRSALEASLQTYNIPDPFEGKHEFYVLVETQGSDEAHDSEKLSRYLDSHMASGHIEDGTVTAEPSKMQRIWNMREQMSTAVMADGYVLKYDVSLPMANYYELVPALRERVGDRATRVCGYGHVGDGNIHINVSTREYSKEMISLVEPWIYEEVSKRGGSISAEHGIGFRKPNYLKYSKDEGAIELMRELKDLMDPHHILNPYKVLPPRS